VVALKKYPDELRARAVRLYRESDPKPVIRRLAGQLNMHPEALRNWIRQDQADRGERDDRPSTDLVEENRRLRKEVVELRDPPAERFPLPHVREQAGSDDREKVAACRGPTATAVTCRA